MLDAIIQIISAIAAYLRYRFDPEMIKRRDEINKRLTENLSHDQIDKAFAGSDTVSLSYFISEFLRRMPATQTNNSSGQSADLLIGELPKRSAEDRDKDPTEGF